MGLTGKRARFVAEFLKDSNATQAALRAGYSARSAGTEGHRLLKNADVSAAIAERARKLAEKLDLSVERIAEEFARYAFAPEATDPEFKLQYEVRPADRLKALEHLAKWRGMFVERVQHSGTVAIAVVDPYAQPPKDGG